MSNILRILLGAVVLIGALLAKKKASPGIEEGEDAAATLSLLGHEMLPSSLNLIVAACAMIGVAMIVLGVLGAMKKRSGS